MNITAVIDALRAKRTVFHSEADFQFALSLEIQLQYPHASVRLEYPPPDDPTKYIDILVRLGDSVYPIELKYKTKLFSAVVDGEPYHLKNHGAQDIGKYDFVKDICRVESFRPHITGYREGYAIWLTNDPYYWNAPKNDTAGYSAFSVHSGAVKEGAMTWGASMNEGSTKGRERPLSLSGSYLINWYDYSRVNGKNGMFMYAVVKRNYFNLQLMLAKLLSFQAAEYPSLQINKQGPYIQIDNKNSNENANSFSIDITFKDVIKQIENMNSLTGKETDEIINKINELESILNSGESKKRKWDKIKPFLL